MASKVLKRGARGSEVEFLQAALESFGFYADAVDGVFGLATYTAVVAFQQERGLFPDGIVGGRTWAEIENRFLDAVPKQELPEWILQEFRGDPDWIHEWEGHKGKPYWPGGASGVTIDPGVDLGHIGDQLIPLFKDIYSKYLTQHEIDALLATKGLRGKYAKAFFASPRAVDIIPIRISRAEAMEIFPFALDPYWDEACKRFETLADADGDVQTAILSICYNRGSWNAELLPLKDPLLRKDYRKLANLIMGMQQDHHLPGITRRRLSEGRLILKRFA